MGRSLSLKFATSESTLKYFKLYKQFQPNPLRRHGQGVRMALSCINSHASKEGQNYLQKNYAVQEKKKTQFWHRIFQIIEFIN